MVGLKLFYLALAILLLFAFNGMNQETHFNELAHILQMFCSMPRGSFDSRLWSKVPFSIWSSVQLSTPICLLWCRREQAKGCKMYSSSPRMSAAGHSKVLQILLPQDLSQLASEHGNKPTLWHLVFFSLPNLPSMKEAGLTILHSPICCRSVLVSLKARIQHCSSMRAKEVDLNFSAQWSGSLALAVC